MQRQLSLLDQALAKIGQGLAAAAAPSPTAAINYPAQGKADSARSEAERRHIAGLMRINHTGEIAAQALYHGQALVATQPHIRAHLLQAAQEERDHLAWCEQRLTELNDRPSRIGPAWYVGSFAIGVVAGLAGDRWSLGFVDETERQVAEHLSDHLAQIPETDQRSRAILAQMRSDEQRHGQQARDAGGQALPARIKSAMRAVATVMKIGAYRF